MNMRYRCICAFLLATLFVASTATAQSLGKNAADELANGVNFGRVIKLGGGQLFASEYPNVKTPGAVYVYEKDDDDAWIMVQKLEASNSFAGDGFGYSIAVNADAGTLVVSSLTQNESKGAAYVFRRSQSSGDWEEEEILTATAASTSSLFGYATAIRDSVVVVGAPQMGAGGSLVLFVRGSATDTWSEVATVTGFSAGEQIGRSAAFAGEFLAAGSRYADANHGRVYVLEASAGPDTYQVVDTLRGDPLVASGSFSLSLSGSAQHIVVGDYAIQAGSGRVAIFKFDGSSQRFKPQTSIASPDVSNQAYFGYAVSVDGSRLIAGAPYGVVEEIRTGTAFVYIENGAGNWMLEDRLYGSDASSNDFVGVSIAIEGDVSAAGAYNDDGGLGTTYVYERDGADWQQTAMLFIEQEFPQDVVGGRVACDQGFAGDYPCSDVDLLSFLNIASLGGSRGSGVNDIWGWTDPQTGHEYAIVGRTDGTSFVDITSTLNPVLIGSLPPNGANSSWRDVKVYSNHAFIVSEASSHGMQVFDLTRLRSTVGIPKTFDEDAIYSDFGSAHNLVINEDTGFAFAVGTSTGQCPRGLHMIDIAEPETPTYAGCFRDLQTGRSSDGYTHDAQCVVYHGPDTDHSGKEICFSANETAISIDDVTDKANPVLIANATYPNVSYAHQGWLSEDQRYFYQDDELDETSGNVPTTRTMIWDLMDLDDPELVATFDNTTESTDHNLYVRGSKIYQSNYTSGLRILDITSPTEPVEEAYFDVYPEDDHAGFNGTWSNYPYFSSGAIIVTGRDRGLFVVARSGDPVAVAESEPPLPTRIVSSFPNPFVDSFTIQFESDRREPVRLQVYDVLGRRRLDRGGFESEAGTTLFKLQTGSLSAGMYLVRIIGETFSDTVMMTKAR